MTIARQVPIVNFSNQTKNISKEYRIHQKNQVKNILVQMPNWKMESSCNAPLQKNWYD